MHKLTEKVNRKTDLQAMFLLYEDLERSMVAQLPDMHKLAKNARRLRRRERKARRTFTLTPDKHATLSITSHELSSSSKEKPGVFVIQDPSPARSSSVSSVLSFVDEKLDEIKMKEKFQNITGTIRNSQKSSEVNRSNLNSQRSSA